MQVVLIGSPVLEALPLLLIESLALLLWTEDITER